MSDTNSTNQSEKLEWETPKLEELGQIEDVAGGAGLNAEGGLPAS